MEAVRDRRVIDTEGADAVIAAAGRYARESGNRVVIAVVDPFGEVIAYLHRPDAAQVASVGVATDKARTAAIYRRPSKDFEDQVSGGRPSALHLARSVPAQGGIPIERGGEVVGAIGVSGASSADEDQELALLGAAAVHARRGGRCKRLRKRGPRLRGSPTQARVPPVRGVRTTEDGGLS